MKSHITTRKDRLKVLLVGYNGANNTGAEALLQADIDDIRAVLGDRAQLTIPAVNVANLRRYVNDSDTRIVAWPPTVFPALPGLVREHDLILLVEGSTYMDTWASVMLWVYLWTTHLAHAMGKPCLAYAVDAGDVSPLNRRLIARHASKTDLIVTRARLAADRLAEFGVTAPLKVTADNAFNFSPDGADQGWVTTAWPEAASGVVGIAAVNFYLWPVVMRLWGRAKDCYKWPFYFSHSPRRDRAVEALVEGYAALADSIITEHDRSVALICMEQLDEAMAGAIHRRMAHPERARIFSSREYNASQMTALLRSLDVLVTSRYHACVLSLAAQVPQVALGHDKRLATIYEDLGLKERWFIHPHSANGESPLFATSEIFAGLWERVNLLLENPTLQWRHLSRGYEEHLSRARQNRALLADFVSKHFGITTVDCVPAGHASAADGCRGGAAWAA